MTNTMSYMGYAARIEYDDDDGIFASRIAGIRDRRRGLSYGYSGGFARSISRAGRGLRRDLRQIAASWRLC